MGGGVFFKVLCASEIVLIFGQSVFLGRLFWKDVGLKFHSWAGKLVRNVRNEVSKSLEKSRAGPFFVKKPKKYCRQKFHIFQFRLILFLDPAKFLNKLLIWILRCVTHENKRTNELQFCLCLRWPKFVFSCLNEVLKCIKMGWNEEFTLYEWILLLKTNVLIYYYFCSPPLEGRGSGRAKWV